MIKTYNTLARKPILHYVSILINIPRRRLKPILFPIIILAISLSVDALGAGIVYGMRKIKLPFVSKLIISLFSIVYSALALLLGKTIAVYLPPLTSKIIGVSILLAMGIWIIIQSYRKPEAEKSVNSAASPPADITPNNILKSGSISGINREKTLIRIVIKSLGVTIQVVRNPVQVDIDRSGIIDPREALLLGLALSVDAIGAGVGSAMAGYSGISIPVLIGLFQIVFLYIGSRLGEVIHDWPIHEKVLTYTPGFLLIFLALLRLRC